MRLIIITILLSMTSCSFWEQGKPNKHFLYEMDQQWQKKSSKENIIRTFGLQYEQNTEGISYNYENSNFTKMAFFFDKDKNLIEQFSIIDEKDLNSIHANIPCQWHTNTSTIQDSHTIKIVHKGNCTVKQVHYSFRKDLGFYEVRWSKESK